MSRVLSQFPDGGPADDRRLAAFIRRDEGLAEVVAKHGPPTIRRWLLPASRMVTVTGRPAQFSVLPLADVGALQDLFRIDACTLDWFADTAGLNRHTAPRLQHYTHRFIPKQAGGTRLVEAPKSRIKAIQRCVLRKVLAPIPTHEAAHGFVGGRSAITFAAAHAAAHVVVRFDLVDFFVSIGAARIRSIFIRLGYPYRVAEKLTGLCCVATPWSVVQQYPSDVRPSSAHFGAMQRLQARHLPQGAPTSPALSNMAAFPLDLRLAGLARAAGARYTRYADDLAFSGDREFARSLSRFAARVGAIVVEEGFRLNYRKTRVMRSGTRQQLCGLVVNQHPNVSRRDYDSLRALLHNALQTGPAAQNREGHPNFRAYLQGRIAWVAATNPARGHKLSALYHQLVW